MSQIAVLDAMVTLLNSAPSQAKFAPTSFTAIRSNQEIENLEATNDIRVYVLPNTVTISIQDRGELAKRYENLVCVKKKLSTATEEARKTEQDLLMNLGELIQNELFARANRNMAGFPLDASQQSQFPPFDPEELHTKHTFNLLFAIYYLKYTDA